MTLIPDYIDHWTQLLMLSGLGPEDRLKSLGIPVIADIPEIGQNLSAQSTSPPSKSAFLTELQV